MKISPIFTLNHSNINDLKEHLYQCDTHFIPSLSSRVSIEEYSKKILENAILLEFWENGKIIGLIAAYCNDPSNTTAYISNISVVPSWQNQGIANQLMKQLIPYLQEKSYSFIKLNTGKDNFNALKFYQKNGFSIEEISGSNVTLVLSI